MPYLEPMCQTNPIAPDAFNAGSAIAGSQCPLCEDKSPLDFMKFRDPHGVDRIDPELIECAGKRHSFTIESNGIRLLAADGALAKQVQVFAVS